MCVCAPPKDIIRAGLERALFNGLKELSTYINVLKNIIRTNLNAFLGSYGLIKYLILKLV